MKDIELQISQFIDNELSDGDQKQLFMALAEDKSVREILSDFMKLKKGIAQHHGNITENLHPIPIPLDQTKSYSKQSNKYKTMFYFSAAAAIVLAMLLSLSRIESQNNFIQFAALQKQYNSLKIENSEVINQKETMKEIPQEPLLIKTINKSIKTKNNKTFLAANVQTTENKDRMNKLVQITEIIQANKAVITKDDFIGGQIVGN